MILDAHKDRTELRLRLYQNGFTPLANKSKMCLLPEWSTFKVTPELIQSREWARSKSFSDTGIRCGDVIAIDIDIDDATLLNDLLDAVVEQGIVEESPFVRIGRPPRELWVYRTSEKIGKRTTGHFVPAGAPLDHKGFAVEILGAGCQFAAYGQRDANTAYQWPEESLLDHEYMDLPTITKAQADAIKDFAVEFFEARGLERRSPAGGTDAGYSIVYDLTPDMIFDVQDVGEMSVEEIGEALRHAPDGEVLRCKVEALRPTGGSWAGMVSLVDGKVCLSDHGTYTSHFPQSADMDAALARLGALMAERFPEPVKPTKAPTYSFDLLEILDPRKALDENLALALKRYVYVEAQDTVHDIRRPTIGMSVAHFRNAVGQYYAEENGERGSRKVTRLADLWLQHPDRINVVSIQMRPDRAWPVYDEDGGVHLNTYRALELPDNLGEAGLGFDLIERLLPIEAERIFFTRWLSYKLQHPETRGPGIVMVAHEKFGTGRGSLISLIRSMFAPGLVQNVDFKTLSGQTYQSQYNEWLADSLVVAVDEAQEATSTLSKWQVRSNAYEHLKTVIDPANHDISVTRKGQKNGPGKTYASVIVMTNHLDAVVLPPNDRRLAILENGETQSEEYWERFHAWRMKPENIAAFIAALREYPLGDYSPFALPMQTAAKIEMVDAGASELDRLLRAAMQPFANTVLVKEQILIRIEDLIAESSVEVPDDWVRMIDKMFQRATRKLPDGLPDRYKIDGRQRVIRMVGKPAPDTLNSKENLLSELQRNGPIVRPITSSGKIVAFPQGRNLG